MRLSKRSQQDRVLPLEITPMIDVVFLLIIFFMAAAQFARLTRADVDLPQEPGEREQAAEEAGLVVNILRDGRIIVGEELVDPGSFRALVQRQMRERAASAQGEVKLLLRVDREADSASLNRVVTELQQLGIRAARIATEVPGTFGGGVG